MKIGRFTVLAILLACPALADDTVLWDSSGNGLLSGTYNFREVTWSSKGDAHRIAIYGSIQFDGKGAYTLSSQVMDSNVGVAQPFSTAGAYRISASGMGFLDDPIRLSAGKPSSTVWGLVSQGVFIGSSTDDGLNNLFIAALAPSALTNASFSGSYWAAGVNMPSPSVTQVSDVFFQLSPDGQGGLGTLSITGYTAGSNTALPFTLNNAAYSAANGALTLGFGGSPLSQPLLSGNVLAYLSADGNFFFGGSATGWDMLVGVRAISGNIPSDALSGMYYQAGVDVTPVKGFKTLSSYYGAFSAIPASGTLIGHQRILPADPAVNFAPYDYTYSDSLTLAADGTHDEFTGLRYVLGAGGAIQIGFGTKSRLGINIALKAPDFSGPGVYLKPNSLANAASSTPFTVGVSRGGFISLYGSNLSSTTLLNDKVPFSLGGVQVLINGRPAPVYYVRSDVVLAIVPFATTGTVASVQVINNGVASAIRTVRIKDGTPGIYTSPAGGVGYAIAQHIRDNGPLVTPQDPARPGEIVTLYVAGLGDSNPPVGDGVPPPSNPPSVALTQPLVLVDGVLADVLFAGLAPTLPGVYAINFRIPASISPGDVYLDISLPDSYTSEAQISIGASNLLNQSAAKSTLEVTPSPEPLPVSIPGTVRRFPAR